VAFNVTDATDAASPGAGSPVQWQGFLQSISQDQLQQYQSSKGGNASTPGASNPDAAIVQSLRASFHTDSASESAPLGTKDVGHWANCSSPCVYSGLKGGAYSFQAKGVDAAGNAGPASSVYAFQLQGADKGLPTWALATIIAGSCVVGIALLALLFCWCRRNKRTVDMGRPTGSAPSYYGSSMGPYPYAGGRPPTGYSNGYSAGSGYHPDVYSRPGAGWEAYNATTGGYVSSSSSRDSASGHTTVTVPEDPIEAQELALALAASQRQQSAGAGVVTPVHEPYTDDELRQAIEASLREAQNPAPPTDSDAELRAAIEASLEEQAQRARQQAMFPGWGQYYDRWPPGN